MDSVYARGGVTSNEDVLRNFCTNTSEVKANNLSTHYDSNSDELLLRQYGVLIATRKGDKLMITSKRYSVTTSKVQNELLRIAMEYGLDVQKTNEFAKGGQVTFGSLYNRIVDAVKKDINVSKEEAVQIVNNHETLIVDMIEVSEITNPKEIADIITTSDDGEYAKGGKTKVQKNKILTTIEKQQYKKLLAAIRRAHENLSDMEADCYDDQYRLEDKVSGANNNLERFVHKMYKKYGNEIEREINTDIFAKGGNVEHNKLSSGLKSSRTKGKYIVNPFFYGTDDYWERRENLERFLNYTNEEIYYKWLSDEINDENAVFMVEEQNGEVFNPKMKYGKGGEVDYYENLAVYVQGKGQIFQGTSMKQAIEKARMYLKKNPNFEVVIVDEKYGDVYDTDGNYINEYAKGGDIAKGNYEMMLSQAKEVEHHVEELQSILKGEKDIDAWVVAKMENVSSTLSDITHYLDGKTEYAKGGKMSRGGYFGKDALVKDLTEEFASEELLAKFRKKSGIKDTQLTKPNVIAFAYTDYGGDFMDKVAIEYFLENYPKNIVVENTGYNGKNAIVFGKVAMDWVQATEGYSLGFEDFESYYYDEVYKEEEKAYSEYLYELQGDGYELDYDEVLSWLLENKGGYYSLTTQGLDFYADDLTKELLEEGLIEKSEEYAKGGIFESDNDDDELDNGEMVNTLPVYEIDLINSVKYKADNSLIYKRASLDIQQYVSQKLAKRRFGSQDELFAYMGSQIYGVSNSSFSDNWDEESFDIKIIIPRDKKMKQELMTYILEDIKPKYNLQFKVRTKLSTVGKSYHYAKGGNINSKTNKKMATKKVKDGQAAPQTKRWIFAFNKGGYNYYNTKEVPYKKPVDADKKGAPVGYRFSKFAEEKGITNNRFRKPTKSEVEQYAGKKKNGKLIMYRETRSNKSDVNPKKKI